MAEQQSEHAGRRSGQHAVRLKAAGRQCAAEQAERVHEQHAHVALFGFQRCADEQLQGDIDAQVHDVHVHGAVAEVAEPCGARVRMVVMVMVVLVLLLLLRRLVLVLVVLVMERRCKVEGTHGVRIVQPDERDALHDAQYKDHPRREHAHVPVDGGVSPPWPRTGCMQCRKQRHRHLIIVVRPDAQHDG